MPADTSLTLGKETRKRLTSLSKSRSISAAELMRNLIDAEWTREHPPLALGFVAFDVRGEIDDCTLCHQHIESDGFIAFMSDGSTIAPLCASCANTE